MQITNVRIITIIIIIIITQAVDTYGLGAY